MAKHGGIKDSGEYFVINPASRKITVPHAHKSIGVVGDHKSEQITFECPQIVDGHEIEKCDRRYITWVNAVGEVGHDELDFAEVENPSVGMVYLSWIILGGLTKENGVVQFSVHFEDGEDAEKPLYRWSTTTCKECDILDSINGKLGAYEAIYRVGNKLVFSNYHLVKDKKLDLTSCVLPTGTLDITESGNYDVGKYAYANVRMLYENPVITLLGGGVVSATANGCEGRYQLDAPTIKVGDGKVTAEASGLSTVKSLEAPDITVKDGEITASANGKASSHFLSAEDFGIAKLYVHVYVCTLQIYYPKINADGEVDYDTRVLSNQEMLTMKVFEFDDVINGMPIYIRAISNVENLGNCCVMSPEDYMMYPQLYVPSPSGMIILDNGAVNNGRDHYGTVAFKVTDNSAHIAVTNYAYPK